MPIARGSAGRPLPVLGAVRPPGRTLVGLAAAGVFLATLVDALRHPPAGWELSVLKAAQRVEPPGIGEALEASDLLTDSSGAVVMWAIVSLAFAAARWWWPLIAALALPLGGVVNEGIGIWLVTRARPHSPELARGSLNWEERSYPSGHVTGAVLLYGLLFLVAGRLRRRWQRVAVRSASAVVMAVTGFDRLWGGAHWPTDVLGSYALGTLLLVFLVVGCDRLRREVPLLAAVAAAIAIRLASAPAGAVESRRVTPTLAASARLAARGLALLAADPPLAAASTGSVRQRVPAVSSAA